jgi:PIN domain nuclease of toxin-antitoxin system
MNYLLDTHILVWAITDSKKLSKKVQDILIDPANTVFVSPLSFWEIALKFSIGKLQLNKMVPEDFISHSEQLGFRIKELSVEDTSTFYRLQGDYHKDPFDRMLIWQAIQNNYTLISDDKSVHLYAACGLKVTG